jgi:hypothetical protein
MIYIKINELGRLNKCDMKIDLAVVATEFVAVTSNC